MGILGEALPQAQDILHKTPSPFIVHIAEMAKESVKGDIAERLDRLQQVAAAEEMHGIGACIQGLRCVIESRRTRAENANCLSPERGEIDIVGRMRTQMCGQSVDTVRHPPSPGPVLSRG